MPDTSLPVPDSPICTSIPNTAGLFGVSISSVNNMIKNGDLVAIRVGNLRRVLMSSIQEYTARMIAEAPKRDVVGTALTRSRFANGKPRKSEPAAA